MRALALTAILPIALATVSGCGGGSAPVSPTPTDAGPVTITIVGERGSQSFSPNPASAAGRSVVFRNTDVVVHRVRLNDGSLDTGDIAPGATSRAVTMPASGTNYHCSLHTGMVGAVSAGAEPPPRCTGPYCG